MSGMKGDRQSSQHKSVAFGKLLPEPTNPFVRMGVLVRSEACLVGAQPWPLSARPQAVWRVERALRHASVPYPEAETPVALRVASAGQRKRRSPNDHSKSWYSTLRAILVC